MTVPIPPPPTPWPIDPPALDRILDREAGAADEARLEALVASHPAFARHVASRRAFLEALSGARWAPGGVDPAHQARLEAQVRAALRLDLAPAGAPGEAQAGPLTLPPRRWRRLRPVLAGAAVLLAGLGVWLGRGGRTVEAFDPVAKAAEVLTWKPRAFEDLATCAGQPGSDVHTFALVRGGEMQITGCSPEESRGGASVAVLHRPEQLPVVGYVAVPADAKARAGEVGITEVGGGRVIVFDVLDHGRRVYLAMDPAGLRRSGDDPEQRWTCAACHGPARQALPNPHRIVLRKAP